MIITITSIKLKHLFKFFGLSRYALNIMRQMRKEKGFLKFKKRGLGLLHFTLSTWESEEDMKRFARSGAHLEAMKHSADIASELRTYSYEADTIPDWEEAKELLMTKGRLITFK